jgi:hypothetical protein
MNNTPTPAQTICNQFSELAHMLDKRLSPAQCLEVLPPLRELCQRSMRQALVLQEVGQAIENLRLDFAYLKFDLEATRRERDALLAKYES